MKTTFTTLWTANAALDGVSCSATSDGVKVNIKRGPNIHSQSKVASISRAKWDAMLDQNGHPNLFDLKRVVEEYKMNQPGFKA